MAVLRRLIWILAIVGTLVFGAALLGPFLISTEPSPGLGSPRSSAIAGGRFVEIPFPGTEGVERAVEELAMAERVSGSIAAHPTAVLDAGQVAELLLPPTRTLVRAKRSLASLPGGGGTPLAAGIDMATLLADGVQRRGGTPTVVLLTDGRANVARDGTGGRAKAGEEALVSARLLRVAEIKALLVDTSPHPQARARKLAEAMGALYLPLPYADASLLSSAVQAAAG
jgi:hypothetical protein